MKHLFVDYDTALLLKEKGFDEECLVAYKTTPTHLIKKYGEKMIIAHGNPFGYDIGRIFNSTLKQMIAAPLYQQITDWFRDEYNFHFYIDTTPVFDKTQGSKYKAMIKVPFQPFKWTSAYYDLDDTYYGVLDKAIKRALDLI